jgi:hypothetical protein
MVGHRERFGTVASYVQNVAGPQTEQTAERVPAGARVRTVARHPGAACWTAERLARFLAGSRGGAACGQRLGTAPRDA